MAKAKITSKGQITIPIAIRQFLGVNAGDSLFFTPEPDGSINVTIAPRRLQARELSGVLRRENQVPVDLDMARRDAQASLTERHGAVPDENS